ncbi:uncharacterized protein LOC135498657 [Lineus longissimus]|uniref:uncharacterized protein LOC135498657 n=1 Tax=Lineus longissimus TaxID=88925 RepID=UPI00315DA91B
MKTKLDYIKGLDSKILDATENDHLEETIVEADDYIFSQTEKVMRIGAILDTPPTPVSIDTSFSTASSSTPKRKVKLPNLNLPEFDGSILQWTQFYDMFRSTVHEDTAMDDIQKFYYLIRQLTGEAARLLKGMPLTAANYKEALELLQVRYGKPHKIIATHMKGLWDIATSLSNAQSLRSFYNTVEMHIRGLKALGKDESTYGELLTPMILEKLPDAIRMQILREHGDNA